MIDDFSCPSEILLIPLCRTTASGICTVSAPQLLSTIVSSDFIFAPGVVLILVIESLVFNFAGFSTPVTVA